jgi:hypothetical protein
LEPLEPVGRDALLSGDSTFMRASSIPSLKKWSKLTRLSKLAILWTQEPFAVLSTIPMQFRCLKTLSRWFRKREVSFSAEESDLTGKDILLSLPSFTLLKERSS